MLSLNEDREKEGRFGVVGGLACLLPGDTGGLRNSVENHL